MERRSMLALTGTALSTALAGCGVLANGGDDGTPTDAPTDTPPGSTPTDTPAPTDTATPTASPTDTDEGTETATPTPEAPAALRNGSFEDDWTAWTVGRDLPTDPNRPGDRAVGSDVGVTTRRSSDGETACRLFIDGSQDDGTVWVQQPVDLSEYDYLAVDYVVSNSFNEIGQPAVYTGPEPDDPLSETDFDTSKSLEGHSRSGWKTFTYEVDHDGPGLVAVGFSIVWETGYRTFMDNVRLSADEPATVTPEPTPTPTDRSDGRDGDGDGDSEQLR
mgnify:CR=1 FL=1|jgi:hypothetical protein